MKKVDKTNAVRLVDQHKVPYSLYEYAVGEAVDGVTVAQKIGKSLDYVYKTLVAQSTKGQLYVFVIPVGAELDLKKAAKTVGEKKIEMLPQKELLAKTGYVRGGCSPIGMKKHYPTWIDDSANALSTMIVSAGKIGMQIELAPNDLAALANASFASIRQL